MPPSKPPLDDPIAYRIAVGAFGVALVAFLIGAGIIAADGKPVPTQYWTTGSAISGALLGILAPTPQRQTEAKRSGNPFSEIVAALTDLWKNRALVLLLVLFGVSVALGVANSSPELLGVASGAGGALVGMLAPPPSGGGGGGGNA